MVLILIILYLGYLTVGISDSFLGAAWPSMYPQLKVSVAYMGILFMIISGGTIISNLYSGKLMEKLGTRRTLIISFALTGLSIIGYTVSKSFIGLCISTVPYGIATGAISVALIKYIALNYKLKHQNWLHCSWGIGSTAGPYIVGLLLSRGYAWNRSYAIAVYIYIVMILILIFSFPFWKRDTEDDAHKVAHKSVGIRESFKIAGTKQIFGAFFCYSALEASAGLWGSSYLVLGRGMSTENAAMALSLFFLGITFGRFVSGFASNRIGHTNLVRIGEWVIFIGIICLFLPFGNVFALTGLVLVGLGSAPIYPCLLQATPDYFGKHISQALIGIQMACAYIGSVLMPPLFGLIAEHISVHLFPLFLLFFIILLFIMAEGANRIFKTKSVTGEKL